MYLTKRFPTLTKALSIVYLICIIELPYIQTIDKISKTLSKMPIPRNLHISPALLALRLKV